MPGRRSNQEGSFHQRNGTWVGRVTVDGRRVRFTGKTRAEVQKQVATFVQQPFDSTNQSVGEYLAWWLDEVCAPKLKPRTQESYTGIIRLYIEPHLGHTKLSKLTAQQVQRWRNDLLASHLSARTVHHAYSVLRTALNRAVKLQLIPRNPVLLVDAPKVVDAEIVPFSPSQVQSLLTASQGNRFDNLFALLAATGIRLGEALGLRWCDLEADLSAMHVRHTLLQMPRQPWTLAEPKSARSKRTIPLIGQARTALQAQRDRQSFEKQRAGSKYMDFDLVFARADGQASSDSEVERQFKKVLAAAALPHTFRPHDLRHSTATYLLAAGVPERVVMDLLGHSNLATTRHYQHVLSPMLAHAAERLESYLASAV